MRTTSRRARRLADLLAEGVAATPIPELDALRGTNGRAIVDRDAVPAHGRGVRGAAPPC